MEHLCKAASGYYKENLQRLINLFLVNIPILYPLKTLENRWFSGVFRGYKMETLARNGLGAGLNKRLQLFKDHSLVRIFA